jgi:formylglycine-generating enzyme required for sulfatase activity
VIRGLAAFLVLFALGACRGSSEKRGTEPGASAPSAAPAPSGSAAANAPPASAPSAAPPSSRCPPEMALIDGRFCIDRWESSIANPDGSEHSPHRAVGPARVRAVSRPGVLPQAYISAEEAELACKRAGKQLCSTQRWQDACMGVKRPYRIHPYGMEAVKGACNTERALQPGIKVFGENRRDSVSMNDPRLNQMPDTVAHTGEFARCATPEGVHDLEGNLLEWTQGDERSLLMGGHYLDAVKHGRGCRYVTAGHGPEYHDYTTGFRCCRAADPLVQAAPGPPRDPPGMRGFVDALGKLPEPTPPTYDSASAPCPVDMVHVAGLRCAAPVERCKTWLPRVSHGEKIACAEFEAPSTCGGPRRRLDYCIDRYEYTPPGYSYPLTHVNWGEAQNLCRAMNKRLCIEEEWEFACEGPEALPYPYGYARDGARCNHDFPEQELATGPDELIDRRVARDALPRCVSPFGVFNLVGNVDEWTTRDGAEKSRRAILRGGWWLIGRNRCRAATANHGERYAGVQTGFRCCKATR